MTPEKRSRLRANVNPGLLFVVIVLLGAPSSSLASDEKVALATLMDGINAVLEATDASYRVGMAEFVTADAADEMGNTVLSKVVGNKQLTFDFVPFDPRRAPWSGPVGGGMDDVTYAVDQTDDAVPRYGGLTAAETTAAIDRAMATWDRAQCSSLPITLKRDPADDGIDIGLVAFDMGLGGSEAIVADIQHAGWGDMDFFGNLLGVTFTFMFIDGAGSVTDIDGNGKLDVAFREIYYDPSWHWSVDGIHHVDVETVALHEAGHGLSQGHFGKVWRKNDGSLVASPRAVMNDTYGGPLTDLLGTDNAGHCSNWASWPTN